MPLLLSKAITAIAKILLVLRYSTTSLGFCKISLPTLSAAKTRSTVKPTADSNCFRAQFVNFLIIQKVDASGARVDVREATNEELQKAQCIHCNRLFSKVRWIHCNKLFSKVRWIYCNRLFSTRNLTRMQEHLVNRKMCLFTQAIAYKALGKEKRLRFPSLETSCQL